MVDNISGPSVCRSLQPLGTYATATQSKREEDILSWELDRMANVNVACNPDLVVHLRATDVVHQAFNHPSDKALSTLLMSPSAMDLQNAHAIYCPCHHCLEGKSQPSKGSHKSFDDSIKPKRSGSR